MQLSTLVVSLSALLGSALATSCTTTIGPCTTTGTTSYPTSFDPTLTVYETTVPAIAEIDCSGCAFFTKTTTGIPIAGTPATSVTAKSTVSTDTVCFSSEPVSSVTKVNCV